MKACRGKRNSGLRESRVRVFVFPDVDALEERLVSEPLSGLIGSLIHGAAVRQCLESAGEVLALTRVSFVLILEFAVDVGEPGLDPVLVSLESVEVDGVSEVCCEELLAFGLESRAGRGQLSQFHRPRGEALVERGLDLLGESVVGVLVDPDALVARGNEFFGGPDGYGLTGAVGVFAGLAGADVVGVANALFVAGVGELQPGLAGGAVEQSFEVVFVFAEADFVLNRVVFDGGRTYPEGTSASCPSPTQQSSANARSGS